MLKTDLTATHCIRSINRAALCWCVAAVAVACGAHTPAQQQQVTAGATSERKMAQLYVRNHSLEPVQVEVAVDDSVIYEGTLAPASISAAIGASRIAYVRSTGSRLIVTDKTRQMNRTRWISREDVAQFDVPIIDVRIERTAIALDVASAMRTAR